MKIKYLEILPFFLISIFLFYFCSEPNEYEQIKEIKTIDYFVPNSIVEKSDTYIISKVGQKFFASYIKYNSIHSHYYLDTFCINNPQKCPDNYDLPRYYIYYKFNMKEYDFINTSILIISDTVGNIINFMSYDGVPNCPNNDCSDVFPGVKNTEEAIQIAKDWGLEQGIENWEVDFRFWGWDGIYNYVWTVKNTLSRTEKKKKGVELYIDATTGNIWEFFSYTEIYN